MEAKGTSEAVHDFDNFAWGEKAMSSKSGPVLLLHFPLHRTIESKCASQISNTHENRLGKVVESIYVNEEVETNELVNKLDHQEFQKIGSKHMDTSTCGALHSVGSGVTRTKGRSDIHQSGSFRSEQTISKAKVGNTPTSRAGLVASRESFILGNEKIRTNGSTNNCDEVDDIICSRSTQDKRLNETSTVKEPILQHVKGQKSLPICV